MRISTSFHELKSIEISLTNYPSYLIQEMKKNNQLKDYSIRIQMTRKYVLRKDVENTYIESNRQKFADTHRHQIVLERRILASEETIPGKIHSWMLLKIYSQKMNASEIRELGFEPIQKAENAEKQQMMLDRLAQEPIKNFQNRANDMRRSIAEQYQIPKLVLGPTNS